MRWKSGRSRATTRPHAIRNCCVCVRAMCSSTSNGCCPTRRLEQSAEGAVQLHFSALSNRTNAIKRTLTVLTAIFLPLNLITGIFGMNFDALPLIHRATGVWIAFGIMVVVGVSLGAFFWRKRYLGTHHPP